jgi:hypothetical protein
MLCTFEQSRIELQHHGLAGILGELSKTTMKMKLFSNR